MLRLTLGEYRLDRLSSGEQTGRACRKSAAVIASQSCWQREQHGCNQLKKVRMKCVHRLARTLQPRVQAAAYSSASRLHLSCPPAGRGGWQAGTGGSFIVSRAFNQPAKPRGAAHCPATTRVLLPPPPPPPPHRLPSLLRPGPAPSPPNPPEH
jgi:hypothetical protein